MDKDIRGLVRAPSTRFEASESNVTWRPSALTDASLVPRLPWFPAESVLARVVAAPLTSRAKTSETPFVSPSTRFDAPDPNATTFPSALKAGLREVLPEEFACSP